MERPSVFYCGRDVTRNVPFLCLSVFVLLAGCGKASFEGALPGECSDEADNDSDGLFDCDDPNCLGAPICAEAGDDDTGADDDDSSALLGPCRPVDHLWNPETEPMRLPCERTEEPCNLIDDDQDGFLDPKCGTVPCTASAECTLGGLMPDADCFQNGPEGPVCTWIDGAPVTDAILLCRGVLCPPGLKCFEGGCIEPGTGLPYSDCTSGADCPINSGCLPRTEQGSDATCAWFCQDFPCPDGFDCNEKYFTNEYTGTVVTHLLCEPEGQDKNQEGQSFDCRQDACPECEDDIDNDSDGLIDCKDPSCSQFCDSPH